MIDGDLQAFLSEGGKGPMVLKASQPAFSAVFKGLDAYFSGSLAPFKGIRLNPAGSPFELRVWAGLKRIKRGNVKSYARIAQELGCPLGARPVGNACSRNPIPIIIPCHRVLKADGSVGGYTGGVHIKKALLEMEMEGRRATQTTF